MKEIKPLTSLRGIAALWVLGYHLDVWVPSGFHAWPIIGRGYLAVDLFLVLSGFILAKTHAFDFEQKIYFRNYLRFIAKRFFRLFPLHWAVLIVIIMGLVISSTELPWRAFILGEAALVHRWNLFPASMSALNGPDWSISTEWAANLAFPAYMIVAWRGRIRRFCFGLACCATIVLVGLENHWSMDAAAARSWLPLMRCSSEFGIGVLLARISLPYWLTRDTTIALIIIALVIALLSEVDIVSVGLLGVLIPALAFNNGKIARALSIKMLNGLGKISYSIYLVQVPVITASSYIFQKFIGNEVILYIIISFTTVNFISYLSFKWIEQPIKIRSKAILQIN